MFKQVVTTLGASALTVANAYATTAPTAPVEENGFPLAIVFALIAVFFGAGTAIFAATQSKKNKD